MPEYFIRAMLFVLTCIWIFVYAPYVYAMNWNLTLINLLQVGDIKHFFREVKALNRILQRSGFIEPGHIQQLFSEGKKQSSVITSYTQGWHLILLLFVCMGYFIHQKKPMPDNLIFVEIFPWPVETSTETEWSNHSQEFCRFGICNICMQCVLFNCDTRH